MKVPYWVDPNDNIKIIEPTEEAAKEFGFYSGYDLMRLTDEHIEALKNGKMLAWADGEYATFVIYKDES